MRNSRIEWCDMTWNPVTGCLHGCEYCYARRIANRFGGFWDSQSLRTRGADGGIHELNLPMTRHTTGKNREKGVYSVIAPYPYCFDPTLHCYRLDEPQKYKMPQNIFVCSMADLFGDWVPDEWILNVFYACEQAPQHNYLFLTKNPKRYMALDAKGMLPVMNNFWYGSTITDGENSLFFYAEPHKTFLSIEPIIGHFDVGVLQVGIDWIIMGAMTGPGSEQHKPEQESVDNIVVSALGSEIPVFMKDSMKPYHKGELLRQLPAGLRRNG